jgi:hypothetical protein
LRLRPAGTGPRRAAGPRCLLADLTGDGLLLGVHLLAEADPLHRHGLGADDRALLVHVHLVLGLGDLRAGVGVGAVLVGDRLALQPHLLTAYRHGHLDLLGDHVLAQPGAASGIDLRQCNC